MESSIFRLRGFAFTTIHTESDFPYHKVLTSQTLNLILSAKQDLNSFHVFNLNQNDFVWSQVVE